MNLLSKNSKAMISYWLLLFFIIIFSSLLVVILVFVFRISSFAEYKRTIVLTFLIPAIGLFLYITFGCLNIAVVKNDETVSRYILVYDTTYKLENGIVLTVSFQNEKSTSIIINDTATPIFFDLIGYSKKGNNSIEYGHKDILPYSMNSVTQYPDYLFSDPPQEVTVSGSNYAATDLVVKGWLHKN